MTHLVSGQNKGVSLHKELDESLSLSCKVSLPELTLSILTSVKKIEIVAAVKDFK